MHSELVCGWQIRTHAQHTHTYRSARINTNFQKLCHCSMFVLCTINADYVELISEEIRTHIDWMNERRLLRRIMPSSARLKPFIHEHKTAERWYAHDRRMHVGSEIVYLHLVTFNACWFYFQFFSSSSSSLRIDYTLNIPCVKIDMK